MKHYQKIMKVNKRILFLDKTPDKKLISDISSHLRDCDVFSKKSYVLYDYDIIILNLPSYKEDDYFFPLTFYRHEFNKAVRSGKVIYCIADSPQRDIIQENTNYSWTELGGHLCNSLSSNNGEVIFVNKDSHFYNHFKDLFSSFKFYWITDLVKNRWFSDGNLDILAFNKGNFPVSFVLNYNEEYGGGKVIFIPQIMEKNTERLRGFYISLIEIGLNILKPTKTPKILLTPTPSWIEEYKIKGEDELTTRRNEIDSKLTEFFNVKKILFESGTLLVKPVSIVFKKLGYETEEREKEGAEDMKIDSNDFKGLVEVKGLKTSKVIEKTKAGIFVGQLFGHLKENYPEENPEDIKLILVLNYDLEKKLTEKRKFETIFTDSALKILKSSEVCVISTLQLFEIYNKIISEGDSEYVKDIRNKIANTNGIFSL